MLGGSKKQAFAAILACAAVVVAAGGALGMILGGVLTQSVGENILGDAASTAILYGVILQNASFILNFIETCFNHIDRREGEMQITTNYTSGHCSADIDIACSIKLRRAIKLAVGMLLSYNKEKATARKKAALRQRTQSGKAAQ